MKLIEEEFFKKFSDIDIEQIPHIWIVGSPRVGSTILYLVLAKLFGFTYFSNLVNDFYFDSPSVGICLQNQFDYHSCIDFKNQYGKTEGLFNPNEASLIFRKWFGGTHPTQVHSKDVIPEQVENFLGTFRTIFGITNKFFINKNQWNSFRVEAINKLLPKSVFIWIRRDIRYASCSTLTTRKSQGSKYKWNSATLSNYEEIQKFPFWQQVVEQQYWHNLSILETLEKIDGTKHMEIWYRDFCLSADSVICEIEKFLNDNGIPLKADPDIKLTLPIQYSMSEKAKNTMELELIEDYCDNDRFELYKYQDKS